MQSFKNKLLNRKFRESEMTSNKIVLKCNIFKKWFINNKLSNYDFYGHLECHKHLEKVCDEVLAALNSVGQILEDTLLEDLDDRFPYAYNAITDINVKVDDY